MKQHNLIIYSSILLFTTSVNFAVYFLLCHLGINYLDANAGAWLASIIITYWAERTLADDGGKGWFNEMLSFCSLHFSTLLIETFLLFFAVYWMKSSSVSAKIIITIITIVKCFLIERKRFIPQEIEQNL